MNVLNGVGCWLPLYAGGLRQYAIFCIKFVAKFMTIHDFQHTKNVIAALVGGIIWLINMGLNAWKGL